MNKIFYFLLCITLFTNTINADSPLTSTDFYKAYLNVPEVLKASNSKGYLSDELKAYLANDSNSLENKLAVINAIGWNHKFDNSEVFLSYLNKNKKYKKECSKYRSFIYYGNASDQICYAYLRALDNYFDVTESYEMSEYALKKSPNSFAINMISKLIKSQALVSINEACYAGKLFNTLKDNPKLNMDMKKESLPYVFEYMNDMSKGCE